MKWHNLGNERCVNFCSQLISRDTSPCNTMKEEGTFGGCHWLDIVCYMLTWLLVSSSKCIPLKLYQPCWSSVFARWFSSIYRFFFLYAPVLTFLTHSFSLFSSSESAKKLSCWERIKRICIQECVTGVVTAVSGWHRREFQISKS